MGRGVSSLRKRRSGFSLYVVIYQSAAHTYRGETHPGRITADRIYPSIDVWQSASLLLQTENIWSNGNI